MVMFEENKHPRDHDGKFTDKAEAQLRYESDMADTERQTRKWTAESRTRSGAPKAQGFNRPSTKSHLSHAKEMGLNEKEYIRAAELFFNGDRGKTYVGGKKYYKYDSRTRLLCICNSDGTIHTFFRAKSKNMFSKLIKQYNLEEI